VIDGSHLQVVAEKVGCARFEWVGQAHVARDDPNSFLRQQTGRATWSAIFNKYLVCEYRHGHRKAKRVKKSLDKTSVRPVSYRRRKSYKTIDTLFIPTPLQAASKVLENSSPADLTLVDFLTAGSNESGRKEDWHVRNKFLEGRRSKKKRPIAGSHFFWVLRSSWRRRVLA
jgi:hypothetical protein